MYLRECNARLCAMPFIIYIHKSHSLLNLFLYILHTLGLITSRWPDTTDIYRCYLNFLAAALAGLPLIAHSIRKSCLPLEVRCTNKPAIAPLELETRSKDRGTGNGISGLYTTYIPGHRQLVLNEAIRDGIALSTALPLVKESRYCNEIAYVIVKDKWEGKKKYPIRWHNRWICGLHWKNLQIWVSKYLKCHSLFVLTQIS